MKKKGETGKRFGGKKKVFEHPKSGKSREVKPGRNAEERGK